MTSLDIIGFGLFLSLATLFPLYFWNVLRDMVHEELILPWKELVVLCLVLWAGWSLLILLLVLAKTRFFS